MQKRLSLLCGILILLLSCQVIHAVELNGSMEALGVFDNGEFNVNMKLKLNMNLVRGDEQQVSLQLKLVPDAEGDLDDFFPVTPGTAVYPRITALMTTQGQFLNAGPVLTTRIGRFSANYSDYVGAFSNFDGIEVLGGRIGDVRLSGLYGFDGDVRPLALRFAGDVDRVQLTGSYVRLKEERSAFFFKASSQLNERVNVGAEFANDKDTGSAYQVYSKFKVTNGVFLKAGIWNYGDFDTPYVSPNLKTLYAGKEDGREVGVEVALAGVTFDGRYLTYAQEGTTRQLMDLEAKKEVLGVTAGIKSQYDIKGRRFNANELTISKVFSIPGFFENIGFTTKYDFEAGKVSLIKAEYTAPNGIKWTATSTPDNPKRLTASYRIEF
jgi:hypothetical protein